MELLTKEQYKERNFVIIRMVINGSTYQYTGDVHGLHRERIRQIIMNFVRRATHELLLGEVLLPDGMNCKYHSVSVYELRKHADFFLSRADFLEARK